jgi:hypothetical protein
MTCSEVQLKSSGLKSVAMFGTIMTCVLTFSLEYMLSSRRYVKNEKKKTLEVTILIVAV